MEIVWNTKTINPENLIKISRGDPNRMLKYLNQFKELIPQRIETLKGNMEAENRKMTRQTLHQMSPQLQFFGIPGIIQPIKRLEEEYETIPLTELKEMVREILSILEQACQEVDMIINEHFNKN